MCYVGVIDPGNPRVESADEVRAVLVWAANFIPKDISAGRITGLLAAQHRREAEPWLAGLRREVAWQIIANRVQGTKMAAEEFGL